MAYASLPAVDGADYDTVKSAVPWIYELVPEAYRQKFRTVRKTPNQTHVEFVREKEIFFDRPCSSQNVWDFAQLRQLVLIEDFKDSLPGRITMYLNENRVIDVSKAAVLVDEYVLTHKSGFVERSFDFDR